MTHFIIIVSTIHETRKIESGTRLTTPLEILPEWYLMNVFNLLRMVSEKLLGVLTMLAAPSFKTDAISNENGTRYQNPMRRAVSHAFHLIILQYSV